MLGVLVPISLLLIMLGLGVLWMFRASASERMEDVRAQQETAIAEKLKGQVDLAMTMVEHAYQDAGPDADSAEVQAAVLQRVKELRFGDDDLSYIWVHYFDPQDIEKTTMLMHPTIPSLDGTDISDYRDMERFNKIYYQGRIYSTDDPVVAHISEVNLFVEMNKVCRDSGGGTVDYYWPKPISHGATPEGHQKMSYVELFEPWNWVIGTGAYVDYIEGIVAAEQAQARQREHGIFVVFIIAFILAFTSGFAVSYWTGRVLGRLYRQLEVQLRRNEIISGELQARNDELEQALAEVKTLSGLLPICSYCKQIRDDQGYWSQMEAYIGARSEAQFSHSICPECAKEHFPDMDLYPEKVTNSE